MKNFTWGQYNCICCIGGNLCPERWKHWFQSSTSVGALELVVTGSQHCKGQIVVSEPYKQGDCHPCVQSGLGQKLGPSDCTRFLVNSGATVSHKLSGNGGSYLDTPKFPSLTSKSVNSDQERQLNSPSVYQSPGGTLTPQLCYKAWKLWQMAIKNNMFLKGAHIAGNLNILPEQNNIKTYRMDTERCNVTGKFSNLGKTGDRPLHHITRRWTSSATGTILP